MFNHQYTEAIEQMQKGYEIAPNRTAGRGSLVSAYWLNGMYQEAIAEREMMDSLLGNPNSVQTTFYRHLASGNRIEALRTVENAQGQSSWGKAFRYSRLNEKDLAIEWLTKAVDERDNTATWAKVQVDFDPLRDDPCIHDLLLRKNLEP